MSKSNVTTQTIPRDSFDAHLASKQEVEQKAKQQQALYERELGSAVSGTVHRQHFEALAEMEYSRWLRHQYTLSIAVCELAAWNILSGAEERSSAQSHLLTFGQQLAKSLREPDLFTDLDGGRFIMMMPHTSASQTRHAVERVLLSLREEYQRKGQDFPCFVCGSIEMTHAVDSIMGLAEYLEPLLESARACGLEFVMMGQIAAKSSG